MSIIFITHALEEALALSDRITILRDGEHVVTDDTTAFDRDDRHPPMVGRDADRASSTGRAGAQDAPHARGEKVLSVQNLSMGNVVRNTSFSIFAGQITGVFGLIGSGRTETAKIVAGVYKRDFFHGGEVRFDGRPGALPGAAPGGRATASSTSPRTARSKASSRPCRSPRTSMSACWSAGTIARRCVSMREMRELAARVDEDAQHHAPSTAMRA